MNKLLDEILKATGEGYTIKLDSIPVGITNPKRVFRVTLFHEYADRSVRHHLLTDLQCVDEATQERSVIDTIQLLERRIKLHVAHLTEQG